MIPADLIEQARSVLIETVIAERGIVLRGTVDRCGRCPHCGGDDRFSINTRKQVFNCRQCGARGGVVDLTMFLDGCDFSEAIERLSGRGIARPSASAALGSIKEVYDYVDEAGELLFQAARFEPKQFRQRTGPDQKRWSIEGVRIVPFRLPELIEAIALGHMVFVVEGEKDVITLGDFGVPATTNPMGAGKWREDFNEIFRDGDVVICGDNDKPGRAHVELVATNLHGVANRVRVLDLKQFWLDIGDGDDISDWFARGEGTVERLHEIVDGLADWTPKINGVAAAALMPPAPERTAGLIWYGDEPPTPPSYLVDETLPEIGVATIGGQYGAAKTFIGADLASAVMVGGEFAGSQVMRKGGALWLAAEGESEIETRIQAAVVARGSDAADRQPFARQAGSVPPLADKDALGRLKTLAKQAADHLRRNFKCELALIVIDTLSAAAGFDDENSAAETQKVMNTLAALARETKALVVVIDHYGKIIETGVRGSSAKSAANDAILACLGDRDQATGVMSNRKMAVTKLRSGPVGRVVPFDLEKTGDGLTCVVRWRPDEPELTAGKPWPKALIIFRRALDEALDSAGKTTTPRAGMPEVRAVDREAVREHFMRLYVADTPKAKGVAFIRCGKDAVERGIMCSINTGPDLAQTIFWVP
jgi:hypothetical protein